jgi:hypothetical protein
MLVEKAMSQRITDSASPMYMPPPTTPPPMILYPPAAIVRPLTSNEGYEAFPPKVKTRTVLSPLTVITSAPGPVIVTLVVSFSVPFVNVIVPLRPLLNVIESVPDVAAAMADRKLQSVFVGMEQLVVFVPSSSVSVPT